MFKVALIAALAAQSPPAQPENLWRQCKIETATLCESDGCKSVAPDIWLYMADNVDKDGKRNSYYYRCALKGGCEHVDKLWVGYSGQYRVFVIQEKGLISRIGKDDRVTDVATLGDRVLISRGKCWNAPPPIIRTNVLPPK